MGEFISKKEVCKKLEFLADRFNKYKNLEALTGIGFARIAIDEIINNSDVVEVVRCKNCIFWNTEKCVEFFIPEYYDFRPDFFDTKENDFCCHGKAGLQKINSEN